MLYLWFILLCTAMWYKFFEFFLLLCWGCGESLVFTSCVWYHKIIHIFITARSAFYILGEHKSIFHPIWQWLWLKFSHIWWRPLNDFLNIPLKSNYPSTPVPLLLKLKSSMVHLNTFHILLIHVMLCIKSKFYIVREDVRSRSSITI